MKEVGSFDNMEIYIRGFIKEQKDTWRNTVILILNEVSEQYQECLVIYYKTYSVF